MFGVIDMLKKTLLLSSIALLTLSILGCTVTQPPINQSTDCTRLKRQQLYNMTNLNVEAGNTTISQRDAIEQQIQANNCD